MSAIDPHHLLSVGEVADQLSVQSWRVARLFELGVLPEPVRIAGRRMISEGFVSEIREALRQRGWMPGATARSGRLDDTRSSLAPQVGTSRFYGSKQTPEGDTGSVEGARE